MANVIAAPFWSTISRKPQAEKERLTFLRNAFSSLLITGPFSILLGFEGGLLALNDRLKLRSMVVGEKVWSPRGGEPVIVTLDKSVSI